MEVTELEIKSILKVDNTIYKFIDNANLQVGDGEKKAVRTNRETFDTPISIEYEEVPYRVTNIGSCAFMGCQSLTSVELTGNIVGIGHFAFYGCNKLESIIIPESVKRIGGSAFAHCYSLRRIVFLGSELPEFVNKSFIDGASDRIIICPNIKGGLVKKLLCAQTIMYNRKAKKYMEKYFPKKIEN